MVKWLAVSVLVCNNGNMVSYFGATRIVIRSAVSVLVNKNGNMVSFFGLS